MFQAKTDDHTDQQGDVVDLINVNDTVPAKVEYQKRSFTDKVFAVLYILSYIAYLACGIYIYSQSHQRYEKDENGERLIAAKFMEDATQCCANGSTYGLCAYINNNGRRLAAGPSKFDGDEGIFDAFLEAPQIIAGMVALALAIAVTWVVLLRFFAKPIVILSEFAKIAIMITIGIYQEDTNSKIMCFVIAGFMLVYMIWARDKLMFAADIITYSTTAMKANPSIFISSLLTKALYAGNAALFVFFFAESFNVAKVVDIEGFCTFQSPEYVGKMNIYISLSYLWTILLFDKMRLSMIATIVGSWHFHPEDRASMGVAIKNVFPSFGTLSISALIASVAEYLNQLMNQNSWTSWIPPTLFITAPFKILTLCFGGCLQMLVTMFTKFTIIIHVFTGESFMPSARNVCKILKRHFKGGFVTELTSKSVLTLGSYAFSLAIAFVSWKWIDDEFECGTLNKDTGYNSLYILYIILIFFTTWYPVLGIYGIILASKFLQDIGRDALENGMESNNYMWIPPLAATFVGCIAMMMFKFLSAIFLDIIDTLFLCFAIDKDNNVDLTDSEFTKLVEKMPTYTGDAHDTTLREKKDVSSV